MTYTEIQTFFTENIKYKPGWVFHVGKKGEAMFLQIRFMAPNNYRPDQMELQYCRKWQLSEWMTETELVQTAWAAVQRAEMHEASEIFKYKDADIFNTHMNVDLLAELRNDPNALQHRGELTAV